MNWQEMIEGMYQEMRTLLTQEEMERVVDELTIRIYKDKKREDML